MDIWVLSFCDNLPHYSVNEAALVCGENRDSDNILIDANFFKHPHDITRQNFLDV